MRHHNENNSLKKRTKIVKNLAHRPNTITFNIVVIPYSFIFYFFP